MSVRTITILSILMLALAADIQQSDKRDLKNGDDSNFLQEEPEVTEKQHGQTHFGQNHWNAGICAGSGALP